MQEFIKKQMLVGMGVLVLLLVLAQLSDQDYRSAGSTTATFVFGFVAALLWLRYKKH